MITFIPNMLSPLHLACYSRSQKELEEKKRRFQRLSQKMKEITTRYKEEEEDQEQEPSNVELFYDVYHHIDDLSLKELKVLREYCSLLKDVNCMKSIQKMEDSLEVFRVTRLEDTISEHIQKSKEKGNPLSRRF